MSNHKERYFEGCLSGIVVLQYLVVFNCSEGQLFISVLTNVELVHFFLLSMKTLYLIILPHSF